MHFKLAFATMVATVIATVHGTAVVERANAIEARAVDGHVFICTDGGFAGDCTNFPFAANVCSTFPNEFQDNISSIGPDQGWKCNAFSNLACSDNEGHIVVQFPGFAHLGDLGWNDKISSISCSRI